MNIKTPSQTEELLLKRSDKNLDAKELRKRYKELRKVIFEIGDYIYEHGLGYSTETRCLKLISKELVKLGVEKADLGEYYETHYYYYD